jgi:hypothetical protein
MDCSESYAAELDLGDIRGNFAHDYEACIAMAVDKPILRAIEQSVGILRERSVTVRIETTSGSRDIGLTCNGQHAELAPCIFTTPNPRQLGVRLQGCVYVVDVETFASQELPIKPLTGSASDTEQGVMFLADYVRVFAFDGSDVLWTSERAALDGITQLSYSNGVIRGFAGVSDEQIVPFSIDAKTGKVQGGFPAWFPDWPSA